MSIATQIQRLQSAKAALATSIENKGVTVPSSTKLDGYAALVDQIQQGGDTVIIGGNDCRNDKHNIIGADGNLIAAYSPSELAALSSLPSIPSIDGLTPVGWSMTLEQFKNSDLGDAIYPRYTVTDGKIHIIFVIPEGGATVRLMSLSTGTHSDWTVDWGDGTAVTSNIGTYTRIVDAPDAGVHTHTYTAAGEYECKVSSTTGISTGPYGAEGGTHGVVHNNTIRYTKAIYLPSTFNFAGTGTGNSSTDSSASTITEDFNTNVSYIEARGLFNTMDGGYVIVDDNWVESSMYTQSGKFERANIYGIRLHPAQGCSDAHMFAYSKLTAIYSEEGYINSPQSRCFACCERLRTIPEVGGNADAVGDFAFFFTKSLRKIVFQSGVKYINRYAFRSDLVGTSLERIDFPSSVTSISSPAVYGLYADIYLRATTPPTLNSVPTCNCTWYVPASALFAYENATNWSVLYANGKIQSYNF